MNYRPLGKTGLSVSEIGFGCWGIGGVAPGTKSYGPTDDAESIRTLHRALERGVNFYDTSDLYGLGHSEEVLAAAFLGRRTDVLIASKAGFVVDASGKQHQQFTPQHIRSAIERSLQRLRTDYIDLYQLHDPPMDDLRADPSAIEVMKSLLAEGKIRAWGISARSPADGLIAVQHFHAPAIQINFNMIDQRAVQIGLLDACVRAGAGIIARTPLCFGFLTGRYNAQTRFDPDDHRAGWPIEQIALWASAPELFRRALNPPVEQTSSQLALRYCLSYPAISTIIPGFLKPQEVDENLAAADLGPLLPAARAAAESVYQEHVFFAARKGA
jgi:aryl-alcohol dehydrogenase-like predicted oxidoreductase